MTAIGTKTATMTAAVSGDTVGDEDVEPVFVPDVGCTAVADSVDEIGAMGLPVERVQEVANLSDV